MSHIQDHSNLRINVRTKKTVFSLNSLKLPFLKKIGFLIKENKQLRSILRGSGASSAANVDLYGEGQISQAEFTGSMKVADLEVLVSYLTVLNQIFSLPYTHKSQISRAYHR